MVIFSWNARISEVIFIFEAITKRHTFAWRKSSLPWQHVWLYWACMHKSPKRPIKHGIKTNIPCSFILAFYSELGAWWEGKPVTRGYSEQIQSFAGIFSDWYGNIALHFNPTAFNADSIVALAKEAGMKSIVITTKHHDGFCMFHTTTNWFQFIRCNSRLNGTLSRNLADACQRGGVRLGLYYSIIDWHYPYGHPISSHNCDFVTPEHHESPNNR